jgi:nucleoside-diphosphate-sugar epimerase
MKVLVTGGAGYIGDAAVNYLLNEGHEVTVLDNLMYGHNYMRRHKSLTFIRGDITNVCLLRDLVSSHDSVLHLAAIVGDGACAANPEKTIRVNQIATYDIAAVCKDFDRRLVFASTCSVYGANNDSLDEDSPTNPLSLYAGTKLNAEKFVREVPRHYIFRLGTLFGLSTEHARLRCDLVANILTYKACSGEKLTVFGGEQYRPLLHVKDAGELMALAAVHTVSTEEPVLYSTSGRDKYGTYILARANYTILELAELILAACGRPLHQLEVTEIPFEDQRNYKVSSKRRGKFWLTERPLILGVSEMKKVIDEGRIADVWNVQHHNARYTKEVLSD